MYDRPHRFLVLDSLVATDSHTYEQHFDLHHSLGELSFPAPGVVVARSGDPEATAVALVAATPLDDIRADGSMYFPEENVVEETIDVVFSTRHDAGTIHLPVFVIVLPPGGELDVPTLDMSTAGDELSVSLHHGDYSRSIAAPVGPLE